MNHHIQHSMHNSLYYHVLPVWWHPDPNSHSPGKTGDKVQRYWHTARQNQMLMRWHPEKTKRKNNWNAVSLTRVFFNQTATLLLHCLFYKIFLHWAKTLATQLWKHFKLYFHKVPSESIIAASLNYKPWYSV